MLCRESEANTKVLRDKKTYYREKTRQIQSYYEKESRRKPTDEKNGNKRTKHRGTASLLARNTLKFRENNVFELRKL